MCPEARTAAQFFILEQNMHVLRTEIMQIPGVTETTITKSLDGRKKYVEVYISDPSELFVRSCIADVESRIRTNLGFSEPESRILDDLA